MDDQKPDTRVWFGGVEVQFVGWTNYGLVYTRVGSVQTLANLTKSTVRRLLRDGTLRVEGFRPDWADPDLIVDDDTGQLTPPATASTPDHDASPAKPVGSTDESAKGNVTE
jgi:hypothetical protein